MKSRIALLQRHTHGGRLCTPGEVIEVDPDLADWLIDVGVAQPRLNKTDTSSDSLSDSPSEPASEAGFLTPSKEKRK